MDKLYALNRLFRNKVIFEMTLEDLEIWEGYEKIYPSCLRFPESVEWNMNYTLRGRKKCIKDLKDVLKRVDKYIQELLGLKISRASRDKEVDKFIKKQDKMLKIHLKKLKVNFGVSHQKFINH